MGRILSIDYGRKRSGIAVTDPLRIIANGLTTVPSHEIFQFLENYFKKETVDIIVVGYPKTMNNKPSEAVVYIQPFVNRLKKVYPRLAVELVDERFTSKIAFQTMIDGGLGKKKRQNKELVDTISAAIILQSYLEIINKNK
ncbi:MAG: Holliday junction resolvase RuvX [Bacteroidales bacterium]|nr:Holliday junction resolvase RuvX [Bacteroidales bacterium]